MLIKFCLFLFVIGEACDFSPLNDIFSVWKLEVNKCYSSVTYTWHYSSFLEDMSGNLMKLFVVDKVKNYSMTSSKINTIIMGRVNFRRFMGVSKLMSEDRIGVIFPVDLQRSHLKTEWINGGISTSWTHEINMPTCFNKLIIKMNSFPEPKSGCSVHIRILFSACHCNQCFSDHILDFFNYKIVMETPHKKLFCSFTVFQTHHAIIFVVFIISL